MTVFLISAPMDDLNFHVLSVAIQRFMCGYSFSRILFALLHPHPILGWDVDEDFLSLCKSFASGCDDILLLTNFLYSAHNSVVVCVEYPWHARRQKFAKMIKQDYRGVYF